MQYLSEGDEAGILDKIASDKRKVNIRETNLDGAFFSAGGFFGLGEKNVWYNPTSGVKTVDEKIAFGITGEQTIKTIETGEKQTPALGLYHELGHAFEYLFNRKEQRKRGRQEHISYHDLEEKYIIETYENPAAKKLNEAGRNNHRGVPFNTTGPTSTDPQKGN